MEEKEPKEKLSYEALASLVNSLEVKCKRLQDEVVRNNTETVLARLEFLFRVIELKESFSKDFVKSCVKEIETVMTIPKRKITEHGGESR